MLTSVHRHLAPDPPPTHKTILLPPSVVCAYRCVHLDSTRPPHSDASVLPSVGCFDRYVRLDCTTHLFAFLSPSTCHPPPATFPCHLPITAPHTQTSPLTVPISTFYPPIYTPNPPQTPTQNHFTAPSAVYAYWCVRSD